MFTKCYFCGKILLKFWAKYARISESPKDFGFNAQICKKCYINIVKK